MPVPFLFGDTIRTAALRHEVPIGIIDPLLWAQLEDRTVILTSRLEQERIACAGNPDAYFTRLKRSSSTAATSLPSHTIAAEAFP